MCVQIIGISKEEMDSKRPLVAVRYDAAMKITGMSQLHSFAFHPNGIVEARRCYGANPIILRYPPQLVETLEEEVPLEGSAIVEALDDGQPLEVVDVNAPLYRVDEWVSRLHSSFE